MTDTSKESQTDAPYTSARRALLVGAGMAAALAGAGLAWWRTHPVGDSPAELAPDGFWSLKWETPQGANMAMAEFRGKPLLINFWATWCPPCIEELPLINDFYLQNKANGWHVLGLAVDKPSAVQSYLKRMPLAFPVGLAGVDGSALGKSLGNISESLPFSVVIGSAGTVLQRKLGKLSAEELAQWAGLK